MQNDVQMDEELSSDVVALCALLARIMRRCILEQDERIMKVLSASSASVVQKSEVVHEPAA